MPFTLEPTSGQRAHASADTGAIWQRAPEGEPSIKKAASAAKVIHLGLSVRRRHKAWTETGKRDGGREKEREGEGAESENEG